MHQCDFCCWLYNGWCDCPYAMKDKACADARRKKEEYDKKFLRRK